MTKQDYDAAINKMKRKIILQDDIEQIEDELYIIVPRLSRKEIDKYMKETTKMISQKIFKQVMKNRT